MAYPKVKGSLILKLIIIVLAGVLAYAIILPGEIWEVELNEQDECRFNLRALAEAQEQYYGIQEVYADSIQHLISFAEENVEYKFLIDSLIQVINHEDSLNRVKINAPIRRYNTELVTLDSVMTCPVAGEYYTFTTTPATEESESDHFQIMCPVEPDTMKIKMFFERIIRNHGWINQRQETSW